MSEGKIIIMVNNPTALIVDDNFYNRDIFRIALEGALYDVTEAGDGAAALSLLENQTYHLMVLDLQMPGIDGQKVLERVRKQPRFDSMRVVVVTANSHMVPGLVESLADHVMFKPVEIVDFGNFARRLRGSFLADKE